MTRIRASLVGLTLFACSGVPEGTAACEPSSFRSSPPRVIAHAGGEGLGPGNTILAMHRSIEAGADVLDVDIRMTSDGVIVARHDRDLSTTTDAVGNVDEHTWVQLQALDTRAKWTGEPIGEPVRIPSLEQVLREFPDTLVSIELKQEQPSMATELCDVLERTGGFDHTYFSSNTDASLYEAQRTCPDGLEITTTYADVDVMREVRTTGEPWCAPAEIGQPPYRDDRFTPADVAWSHDHGLAIFTWTVDDPETLRELFLAGVDGVYTRRPDIARAVFDSIESNNE